MIHNTYTNTQLIIPVVHSVNDNALYGQTVQEQHGDLDAF